MTTIMQKLCGLSAAIALAGIFAVGCGPTDPPLDPPPPVMPGEAAEPETAIPDDHDVVPQPPVAQQLPDSPAELPAEQDVAAKVDGVPIMVSEVRAIFDQRFAPYRDQIPPEQLDSFWQAQIPVMLEMAIGQHLIQREIEQRGISVSDAEIEAKLAEFKEQIPPGQSIEQLTGQTSEEIRHAVRDMLMYENLLAAYDLTVAEPSEEALQAYYDENIDEFQMPATVQARHILLSVDETDDDEARAAKRAELENIRTQLTEEDADFAALAEAHSDCPSRQRGGDLGAFGRGQMVPPFEDAAFSQEPGVVGDIVETDFGYHIIQVIEAEAARQAPMEEVRDHISGRLQEQAHRKHQESLLKKLRGDAEIQYLIP